MQSLQLSRACRDEEPAELVGVGHAPAHHGELLQGSFADGAGRLHRALVTLPHPGCGTRAVFRASYTHGGVLGPPALIKVRRAAMLTLGQLSGHRAPAKGGQIEISSNIPCGVGMGSSTSDVTATIRAVADCHGLTLSKEEVARLAVLAECASDSTMIEDRVVLFAHREGFVLETFGRQLPPMIVLCCDTDPAGQVDTLGLPPVEYTAAELAAFGILRAGLRRAVAVQDAGLLGRVATASSRINQHYLPKPDFELLLELSDRYGGCGVQVAHSGTVAGLIFDATRPSVRADVQRCADALDRAGIRVTSTVEQPGEL